MALSGAAAPALAAQGGGATVVRGQAFYVDGAAYRTVATPNMLPATAPDHSFDVLYNFSGTQQAVAEAAPGQPGYNGGRWKVNLVAHAEGWEDYADGMAAAGTPVFVSDEAVEAAIAAGALTVTPDVVRFTCPVIRLCRLPGCRIGVPDWRRGGAARGVRPTVRAQRGQSPGSHGHASSSSLALAGFHVRT